MVAPYEYIPLHLLEYCSEPAKVIEHIHTRIKLSNPCLKGQCHEIFYPS